MKARVCISFVTLCLAACASAPQAPHTAAALAPAASAEAHASLHKSPLGFTVMVPDSWMILSQEQLKKNANLLSPDNPMFAKADKNIIFMMKQKIESGDLELLMSTSMENLMMVSNISFAKQIGRMPDTADAAKQLCAQLPDIYSKMFGMTVTFQQCGLESIGGRNMMHIINSGALPGSTSVQYFLQQSQNEMLVVTGTFSGQTLAKNEGDLDAMVKSISFNQ